jgi:hypothetical protein
MLRVQIFYNIEDMFRVAMENLKSKIRSWSLPQLLLLLHYYYYYYY